MTKNKVHVKIGGASYTIVTEDEAEYVEALADEISENMRAIINSNPSLSMTQAAVLVALNELLGTNLSDDELCDIGCASFKIEGRMKRPEYVAAAVTSLLSLLRLILIAKRNDRN